MYKNSIRRFNGNCIPNQGGSYDELRVESGTELNIIAREFTYEGAEDHMNASDLNDPLPMPLPYRRIVFEESAPGFVFNYMYNFKFAKDSTTLICRLHEHHGVSFGESPDDPYDLTIETQQIERFRFSLVEVDKSEYAVKLGVRISVRRMYNSLARTLRRIEFHEGLAK